VMIVKILRSTLESLLPSNATTSRIHVVRPSVEVSRAEYSMDSMKRSMKSRCGDVFVVLRWWNVFINYHIYRNIINITVR